MIIEIARRQQSAGAIDGKQSIGQFHHRDRLPADPSDPEHTGSNLASAALLAKARSQNSTVAATTRASKTLLFQFREAKDSSTAVLNLMSRPMTQA